MTTGKRITGILTVAVMAMVLAAGLADAGPVSIDVNVHGAVQSGEPTNAAGLTLPGQVGDWYALDPVPDSPGGRPSITTPGGTFTYNTLDVQYGYYSEAWFGGGYLLREDRVNINYAQSGSSNTWEITGLIPVATYNIICYGKYDPNWKAPERPEGYNGGRMWIVGYNGGNAVMQDTYGNSSAEQAANGYEGDWNFTNVTADVTGKISGILDGAGWSHCSFCGIQWELVTVPPPRGGGTKYSLK